MTSVAVVVPTIREECLTRFLTEWQPELGAAKLIVVEDNPRPSFTVPAGTDHYAWDSIERDHGAAAWIFPRRTDAVRSYGYWQAWRSGADIIWTLDDDCYPEDERRGRYLELIETELSRGFGQDSWHTTMPGSDLYPRGYPYRIRGVHQPVMLHHGLWSNVPDLDGVTQQANPDFRLEPDIFCERVPYGQFFPMCGMNLAWRRDLTPAMYFLLMGEKANGERWGFDRFGDIWAGLLAKRICDRLGWAVTSGSPSVHHSRASDPERNAALEAPGIAAHEDFWRFVDSVPLTGATAAECYHELAAAVAGFAPGRYWQRLSYAMTLWADLFRED